IGFVLLGEQVAGILEDLVHSAEQAGQMNGGGLRVDVAMISAGWMLLRFLWGWLALQWNLFKSVGCGKQRSSPPWQIVV
ncbi:Na+/H+ antiporter, partial [Xylella fastidiosa subsp. multiplex]|nr:Na+/H+ antiporter [Xylella fastidiosa subsp. multiplex]